MNQVTEMRQVYIKCDKLNYKSAVISQDQVENEIEKSLQFDCNQDTEITHIDVIDVETDDIIDTIHIVSNPKEPTCFETQHQWDVDKSIPFKVIDKCLHCSIVKTSISGDQSCPECAFECDTIHYQ